MQTLTLLELNGIVRQSLLHALPDEYWVQAELSDVRVNPAGHCYVEFVQKDARNHTLVAKARGTVWGNVFRLLRPYFERETGQPFVAGIKVLVKVRVEFHELYGYSLTIVDIDPSYTVGDMVRRRREILRQLEEEGVINLNKELTLSIAPQRVAIISSSTAAGYDDFCNQLRNNPYGLHFSTVLFPAVMQGDKVEESILDALELIQYRLDEFDVVVIIRGGGAVSDLAGFDTYLLAAACAQFPLPIITGIGHERDDTVLDMVANTRVKTPTAAAQYLISRVYDASLRLEELADTLRNRVMSTLDMQTRRLAEITRQLPHLVALRYMHEKNRHDRLWQRTMSALALTMESRKSQLQLIHQRTKACDIEHILSKGFSLVLKGGRVVTDSMDLHQGDAIHIRMAKGTIVSEVKTIEE